MSKSLLGVLDTIITVYKGPEMKQFENQWCKEKRLNWTLGNGSTKWDAEFLLTWAAFIHYIIYGYFDSKSDF